ncbi:uncharacterized protein TA05910 [Theileria annulata]|uniref:RING-type domain-containing protein n=1 Tax=Theileria annulata TaxID=5874 RepID=Q4UI23_THEAN|nr:uncharacterized protein TA05910 [Theileria annulata]CAI73266.1 hypothetical protein, conserved [Theileria annulata]|eukprot:XP_953943.1 hypothetical protein, conserved [Theileria annulata]
MDKNRRFNSQKSTRGRNGRFSQGHPREKGNNDVKYKNKILSRELKEITLDVFFNSRLSQDLNLPRQQVDQLLDFKPSHHFNSYLNCCICYENTLICAVGKCDHITCLLCSLKLSFFYNTTTNQTDNTTNSVSNTTNNGRNTANSSRNGSNGSLRGTYECPYCKQQNDFIYFCVNPFYVHLAKNNKFYSSNETPALTKAELTEFIYILTKSRRLPEQCSNSSTINIMQLYKIFLNTIKNTVDMLSFNGLSTSLYGLGVSGSRPDLPDLISKISDNFTFHDDFVILSDQRMFFESAGIYYLYKVILSPLCWFPECKEQWYLDNVTKSNLVEALKGLSRHKYASYKVLNKHIKASHTMVFCDICLSYFANKKFVCEFTLYNTAKIGDHVKYGDVNSYPPINPHVCCPACKTYHWDMTAFKQHAKDEHFICELCDSYDDSYCVFSDYNSLFNHFKTYHYPCEEEECMFIVFSDDIQLQLHYLYKHPGVARVTKGNKKPIHINNRANTATNRSSSCAYYAMDDNLTYDTWDGSINICDKHDNSLENVDTIRVNEVKSDPLDGLEDTKLYSYISPLDGDVDLKEDRKRLDKFLKGLKGSRHLPVSSEYINNFDVTKSSHVFNDLETVLTHFRRLDIKLFDITSYLTELLSGCYISIINSFTKHYNNIINNSDLSDGTVLFNLVKSYLLKFVLFFYTIHINRPRSDSDKLSVKIDVLKLREHNPDVKLGANGILFLIAALNFSNISNRIIVKASLSSIIEDMKTIYKESPSPMSLSEAFNLNNSLNSSSGGGNISSNALNPNADINEYIAKKPRSNNIVKIPRKDYIVTLKGKKMKNKPQVVHEEPVDTTTSIEEPIVVEPDNPTPINISDGLIHLEALEADNETLFMNHVGSCNFYGLMCDMIGSLLISNMKRYKAKSFDYSLRETTKLKILAIALSQKRSLTNLGEFISMKKLESLQSLEPEFHRLVKECKKSDLPTIAKVWNKKCTNILKNTQVEHLEILHFYLKGNSDTCMPLCNDTEFPSLTKNKNSPEFTGTRNYASAAGVVNKPKFMNDLEFPTLKQTAHLHKKNIRK